MIPRDTIEKINASAHIEEVVSDYVSLHKRGANLIGLCPFHNEKTGSFTVSPSMGIYKCFGCGASGNAVKFIMEIEKCSYTEALKQLGKKYHIEIAERELTAEEKQHQDNRESMFVVNQFANNWFQEQLWQTNEGQAIGLTYFRERGIRDDIIRVFQLGYSPEKGSPLAKALKEKGFSEEFVINNVDTKIGCGLCGKSEDGRWYDRFRDRVMFPIFTVSGKPVGFAGRILKKKENVGKYINSPDSLIYSKTNELYGLFQAKKAIAREDVCYLVEGQMDVISMHQAGIENVVASGGTALTKPQIWLIRRFTSNITVIYDGDSAGIHAALRGVNMFLEEGFNVKVLLLPEGEDPDSFAQSHDSTEFIQYIQSHQTDFIQFKTAVLSKDTENDPQKRAALIKELTASIAVIPDLITRQVYIKNCAERLHISEKVLTVDVINIRKKKSSEARQTTEQTQITYSNQENAYSSSTVENNQTNEEQVNHPSAKPTSLLDQNYYNLIQLIVRYGEQPIEVGGSISSIGELIIYTLKEDGIQTTNPVYQKIIDEFLLHCKEEGFESETFFKIHSDAEISLAAVEFITDHYQLSTLFLDNSPIDQKQKNRFDNIGALVVQYLYEIKLTVINIQIDKVNKELKAAESGNDLERQNLLLSYQTQLINQRNLICKKLGNRIIT